MLAWIAAAGCLVAALAQLALSGRRRSAVLPLADVGSLGGARRRTWLLWSSLAGTLVAVLAVFVVQARAQTPDSPILQPGADAVVVIDLSSSTRGSSKAIAHVLLGLTQDPKHHLGLVVFSDSAYEALPPSTPVDGLKGWLDLFAHDVPKNYPWTPSFSSGTVISSGLVLARRMIRRDRIRKPHVVLVSDLIDAAADLEKLETVVAGYQREGIDLKVVSVRRQGRTRPSGPLGQPPNASFVKRAASATVDPGRSGSTDTRLVVLLVLVAALGLLAALHELAFHPLSWRTQT